MSLANCTPFWIAASDSSEPSVGSRICLNIVTSFVIPFDRAGSFVASKKKPAHPSDKSPEWLALNSPFHFPLRRTSCVPPVWPQIIAEAFSMVGEAHERTIITSESTVKNLYLASGFSAIRTRSEERLKTVNGELARAISKFNAHLLIFLRNNPSTEIGCHFAELFGFKVFDDFLAKGTCVGRVSDSSRLSSPSRKMSRRLRTLRMSRFLCLLFLCTLFF